ncbi:hypothetical protein OsJ_31414 [Oryza sativa Japonica Group]|uniref:Uncharacterized protein n=1 Tax=Oryza sativa subsp. japonica TaxID=39947 RepID=B9G5K8_ORYSJ|nr:hypothetical protein OsJ_31414 [Oryza sativa Japonica Group]
MAAGVAASRALHARRSGVASSSRRRSPLRFSQAQSAGRKQPSATSRRPGEAAAPAAGEEGPAVAAGGEGLLQELQGRAGARRRGGPRFRRWRQ